MENEILSQLRQGINEDATNADFQQADPQQQPAAAIATDTPNAGMLDLSSNDLFPALPAASAPAKPAWRPAVQKIDPAAVAGANGSIRKLGSGKRQAETLEIPLSLQQKLPKTGKNSIQDHAKAIGLRTQTTVEFLSNKTSFVISGKPENTKAARKELLDAIGVFETSTIKVPSSVRPIIIGAAGKNLKDLTARTGTNIQVPKVNKDSGSPAAAVGETSVDDDGDDELPIVIKGNFEGVRDARNEILEIVKKRSENMSSKISIDRTYHPFIVGANNNTVQSISERTGAKIHIPPLIAADKSDSTSSGPERDLNVINLVGSRESIRAAESELMALYEDLKKTTRTLSFVIPKRQHRFIIGSKGIHLQDILKDTGCFVELPGASDASDLVTVRGPDSMLSVALQSVLQKANQTTIEEVKISSLLPPQTDTHQFFRYLFTKHTTTLKKIEQAHNGATIHRTQDPLILEVHGKSKTDAQAAAIELAQIIRDVSAGLYFGGVEVPRGLHRFVVGKGGQNIAKMRANVAWEGRLVDLLVPAESDGVDEVVIIAKRLPNAIDDVEVGRFVEKVRAEIMNVASVNAEFVSEVVNVPGKFHGRLIGAGGKDLKDLVAGFGNEISIRFPPSKEDNYQQQNGKDSTANATEKKGAIDPDTIVIKGSKKLVAECKLQILKIVGEFKRIETLASFTDSLKVKRGNGKKLVHGAGSPVSAGSKIVNEYGLRSDSIGWLIRLVKEYLTTNPPKVAGDVTADDNHMISLLKAEVQESTKESGDDVITLTGPKNIVVVAKKILQERATNLANQVTVEFKVFLECSKTALEVLKEDLGAAGLKSRVMRRLIGKGGRNVKGLMEKFGVSIQFPEGGKRKGGSGSGLNLDEDDEVDAVEGADDDIGIVIDGLVIVKGSPKNVEAAKAEIMSTVENEIIKSFSTTFEIASSALPAVLGPQGSKIKALRESHGVRIDLRDIANDDGEFTIAITLEGSKKDCLDVRKKILDTTDEVVNVETRIISIPAYIHKDIIGQGGARIKSVIDAFGGPEKVKVQFPPRGESAIGGTESNAVSVRAHVSQIDNFVSAIMDSVNQALSGEESSSVLKLMDENTAGAVVLEVEIPIGEVPRVLGKGGESVKEAMRRYGVVYWFVEKDSECVVVRAVGIERNAVEQAVLDIKGKLRSSKKVLLPPKVCENLATAGAVHDAEAASVQDLVKKVRGDTSGYATAEINANSLAGCVNAYITVRGDAKNVDIAVKSLEKGLLELTKYDVSIRVPVAADLRGHIIGKAGATISKIRAETSAYVELTKSGSSDVVLIRGTSQQVADAKILVEKILADQAARAEHSRKLAEARDARESVASPHVNGGFGTARIDDDFVDTDAFGASSYVPGFAPGQKSLGVSARGKKQGGSATVPAVPVIKPTGATESYYSSFASSVTEDSWKPVSKRGAKKGGAVEGQVESAVVDANSGVPGSGPSKKKRNKKTGAVSGDGGGEKENESPAVTLEEVVVTAPASSMMADSSRGATPTIVAPAVVAPIIATQPAPAAIKGKSHQEHVISSKPATTDPYKRAVSVTPTPSSTPAALTTTKKQQLPAAAEQQVVGVESLQSSMTSTTCTENGDDGWTVISKKGSNVMPVVTVDVEGAKKKKNKKKKKKTANGGVNGVASGNGAEDDDGDE